MFTKKKPYKSEIESDMCVIGFQNHIIGIIKKLLQKNIKNIQTSHRKLPYKCNQYQKIGYALYFRYILITYKYYAKYKKCKNSPLDISSSRDSAITPFFVSRLRSIILYGFRLCISRTVTKSSLLQLSIVSALVKLGRKFELEERKKKSEFF